MTKTIDWIGLTKGREYVPFLLLFVFSLPFKTSLSNVAILLFAAYLTIALLKKRFTAFFDQNSFTAIKYLPGLYAALVVTLIYSSDLIAGVNYLISASFLLVIPILFCYLRLSRREKSLVVTTFVSSNLAAVLFNLVRAVVRSIHLSGNNIIFDASVAGGQPFWYSIVQGGNYFFYDEFSYFQHPTYWAIYLLFSAFALLNSISGADSKRRILFSVIAVALCLGSIFLCSSRIVILSTAALLGIFLVILIIKKKKLRWLLYGVIFLVVVVVSAVKNPRFVGFENFKSLETFHHPRLEVWRSAIAIIKEDPIFGVGIGDAEHELMKRHHERGFEAGVENKYNEHNQYLHIADVSGLFGLSIFLLALGGATLTSYQNRNFLQFAFIASFALVCVVENVLVRRAGLVYFSFFYSLLFTPLSEPSLNSDAIKGPRRKKV